MLASRELQLGYKYLGGCESENYLYDPDVLRTFLSNKGEVRATDNVLAKQSQLPAGMLVDELVGAI